jgi:tryptophanyl-tRNA synthetase
MHEFGHNPNIHFYLQSRFYEFAHFAWILSCNISVGELNRMTQFKSQEDKGAVHTGYLVYPVLMAADILLPSATHVPVGPDQMQHVELTRTIARTMNDRNNLNLTIPEPITDFSSKIMDLQNANCKMSKSNVSTKGTLFICDDQLEQKISRAMTDAFAMPMNVEEIRDCRKEIYNLCNIYRLLNGNEDFSKIEMDFGGRMIGTFKQSLVELVYNKLNPIKNFIQNTSDQQAMQFLAQSESFVASEIQKTMNKINHKFFPYLT